MNSQAIIQGIRDGNDHNGGIRCLQLFRAEVTYFAQLQAEVIRLCRTERGSSVGDATHVTHWTKPHGVVVQFSLLNASGRYDDFSADHDLSCFGKSFHGASSYAAVARMTETFPHTVNFRINVLGPGASLSPHEEHAVIRTRAGSIGLRTRFHLPICTNPGAEMILDGEVFHLEAGTVYLINHGCVHWARNGGEADRIHLLWDLLLTREAFDFMFAEPAPTPLFRRIRAAEWIPAPVRSEEIGAYERIAPLVTQDQARQVGWCDIQ
jgi:hypothetical protein